MVQIVVWSWASEASVGEPVVLHGRRIYRGEWTQVARSSLKPEQCWLRRPPPAEEAGVADNLHWQVHPAGRWRFNAGLRTDHTREIVFDQPGRFMLESSSAVWCRPEKPAVGQPISIAVRNDQVAAAPAKRDNVVEPPGK
jgi:hypothetical protein